MAIDTDVIIVGAGPTGLMLAGELAAAGLKPIVLDRLAAPVTTPKGNGVVGRAALELRRRGVLRGTDLRVVRAPRFRFGPYALNLGGIGSPLHILPVPQRRLEALLAERATRLGATIRRGHEVTAIDQDEECVAVDGGEPRARYLVGCDGAHSLVRKHCGIDFPGSTSASISRLARVTLPPGVTRRGVGRIDLPGVGPIEPFVPHRTATGSFTIAPLNALDHSAPPDRYLVSTHEPRGEAQPTDDLGEDELRASLRRVLGADLPVTSIADARAVVANSRLASVYQRGRVFLAGDAAHIFSAGGSAINAGLLDAIALGERLVAVLTGQAPAESLGGYQAQRRDAAERTLALTRAQHTLDGADDTGEMLRVLFGELTRDRATARAIARLIEG